MPIVNVSIVREAIADDPDGKIVIAAISNAQSARPDRTQLLDGMQFSSGNNLPFRGTVVV